MRRTDSYPGQCVAKMEIALIMTPADIAVIACALNNNSPDDSDAVRINDVLIDEFNTLMREQHIISVG